MPKKTSPNVELMVMSSLLFNQQAHDGWKKASQLKIPKGIKQVVVAGMGGSHLAFDLLATILTDHLSVPLIIHSASGLPVWVNRQTLVLVNSYSGNTQETLDSLKTAKQRKVPVILLTAGGKLAKQKGSKVVFDHTLNPSNQPRTGLGFFWGAGLAVLKPFLKGKIKPTFGVPTKLVVAIARQASQLTKQLTGKQVLVLADDFLAGGVSVVRNQLQETAKLFALADPLPEANHHLLESFKQPAGIGKRTAVLSFASPSSSKFVRHRQRLTLSVLKKAGCKIVSVELLSKNKLDQAVEMILLGQLLAVRLADRAHLDPQAVPVVESFKKTLR